MYLYHSVILFFKQKTEYEMRISDWSSDVCSSDLADRRGLHPRLRDHHRPGVRDPGDAGYGPGADQTEPCGVFLTGGILPPVAARLAQFPRPPGVGPKIGRASWRERGCQYG